jgi:hypothetical protein
LFLYRGYLLSCEMLVRYRLTDLRRNWGRL